MARLANFVTRNTQRLQRALGQFDSGAYWSNRYRTGGNSGAGSYGKFAAYKADFLNDFVREHGTRSVIEFGCGDGAQAELFEFPEYTGVDVTREAVEMCREKHGHREGWAFHHLSEQGAYAGAYDLVLSLDVVYHLIENEVFEAYMAQLFDHAREDVLIYASDHDKMADAVHVRHHSHSTWVTRNRPDWGVAAVHENPHGGEGKDKTFAFFTHYTKAQA